MDLSLVALVAAPAIVAGLVQTVLDKLTPPVDDKKKDFRSKNSAVDDFDARERERREERSAPRDRATADAPMTPAFEVPADFTVEQFSARREASPRTRKPRVRDDAVDEPAVQESAMFEMPANFDMADYSARAAD